MPVSDETPSQAYRQLSLLRRRIASYHSLTGCSLTIYCCDFLGQNLRLVASDRHLDASLSRDLEDAKQSSSVLRGRASPLLHSLGFSSPSKRFAASRGWSCLRWSISPMVLWLPSLLLRLSSQVLRIQKMILHTLVHIGDGPTMPLWVRLSILLARGVILLPARGVGSGSLRLPMRATKHHHIADTGTISRRTRNIFVMLLWLFCWTTSWGCFQPPPILDPAFSQTISRLWGCQYSGWVVHALQESVTDDHERNLLSNPLFHQKDLLAPSTIEAPLQAAGKVVHLNYGPMIPLRVRLGVLLARGGILLHARRLGSQTIHLPMDDSLLLLLVLLCLGDDHKFLHLPSLPQIRPAAHFTKWGDSPPPSSDA